MKERNIMQDFNRETVPQYYEPGSQSELIDSDGYFLIVERPADINKRILHFLATLRRRSPGETDAIGASHRRRCAGPKRLRP